MGGGGGGFLSRGKCCVRRAASVALSSQRGGLAGSLERCATFDKPGFHSLLTPFLSARRGVGFLFRGRAVGFDRRFGLRMAGVGGFDGLVWECGYRLRNFCYLGVCFCGIFH